MKKMPPILAFLAGCFCCTQVFAQGALSGGPDAYGYTFKSSADAASGVTAKWIDITTRAGALNLSNKFDDDNFFGPINFSFEFPFYWYTHTNLYIQSNGAISFNPDLLAAAFAAIPTAEGATDNFMAVHMTDLTMNKSAPNTGQIWFYTDFKDTVIVSWIDVPFFGAPSPGSGCTFQAILTRDGGILYQYIKSVGSVNSNGCTSGCFVVGIENINGRVGLQHSRISTGATPFATYVATTPLAIRWFRPDSSSYTVRDAAVLWNNNPQNGGEFIGKSSPPVQMKTKVFNQGLVQTPSLPVKGSVFKGSSATPIQPASSTLSGILPPGKDTLLILPDLVPTNEAGVFRFESQLSWPNPDGDQATGNNKKTQLLVVVDTSEALIPLDYTDGTNENVIHFLLVTTPYSAGLGTYMEPPFYPCIVKSLDAIVYDSQAGSGPPLGPVKFQLYDDDGKNLLGEKDGSPGTLLFDTVVAAAMAGLNEILVSKLIQLNSGGVYIAVLQSNDNVGIGIDTDTKTLSNRSFEVIGGSFTPSRDRKSWDPIIGMTIFKGDTTQVVDIGVSKIISPTPEEVITADSVIVTVEVTNFGPKPFKLPIEMVLRADTRADVEELFEPVSEIASLGTVQYTFKQKIAVPPPPHTNYERLCSFTRIANDFKPANDTSCYFTDQSIGVRQYTGEVKTFILYPNPASEKLNLTYSVGQSTALSFEIVDVTGRVVLKHNLGSRQKGLYESEILIKDIAAGIYNCRLLTNKGFATEKISIVR